MENSSRISTDLVLIGLIEMEHLKYLYAVIALVIYITIMVLCCTIILIIWTEETLHIPMYIFISNLILNANMGGSVVLPKLITDLFLGLTTIQLSCCLIQSFCIESFAYVEMLTFTIMAYDRFLAVGHPLRYPTLMTNGKAIKSMAVVWVIVFINRMVGVVLTARLSLCKTVINNVYCETMSITRLACGDTTVNNIFGTTGTLLVVIFSMLVVVYCYLRTFLICLKNSMEAHQKAIHTLVTHIVAFSTFMAAALFVGFRYRLSSGPISTLAHVVISMTGLTTSIILNPIIYGIRTEALRKKMIHVIQNAHLCQIEGKAQK